MGVTHSSDPRGVEPGGVLEEMAEQQQVDAAVTARRATFMLLADRWVQLRLNAFQQHRLKQSGRARGQRVRRLGLWWAWQEASVALEAREFFGRGRESRG